MNNIISFANYFDEYLVYKKSIDFEGNQLKTEIVINKKKTSPYNIALIQKKFNPLDFDLEELGNFLVENDYEFKVIVPHKNASGFFTKHYPKELSYLDHHVFDDNKSPIEKRDLKEFEIVDIFKVQSK